jgi:Zn finger protein HypA/HybF involved in hydrogenase expression
MENVKECSKCGKYFFVFNGDYKCPHCGHNNDELDIFSNIFGSNSNPFSNLGGT